ncbi:MAG TPA: DUF2330 domain-containing protein [Actinomycetota bacterium]|jgi:hypothetical protein
MARRLLLIPVLALVLLVLGSGAAFACGGLVAPGHAEVLRKATTLSAWHNGYEHYVTGFQFGGNASSFGYIVPLPGVPVKIEKGGGWTLERLEREINPARFAFAELAAVAPRPKVEVLQQVRIEALDITIVRGGGADVAAWARKNGFDLTPDTPNVLGRYSSSGAVFALAKFDGVAAFKRGLVEGQGQTIHFTIPLRAPWIPLRILALGKVAPEIVDADLFILTDHAPSLSPQIWDMPGMKLRAYGKASSQLLQDLRSDEGMSWLPTEGMWLTALSLHTPAGRLGYDLSIDGGGPPRLSVLVPHGSSLVWWVATLAGVLGAIALLALWRPAPPAQPA